ncbi:MAG: hypothetical protein WC685_06900 [Methylobacter sp.]|jgi:hypothetical protein
MNRLAKALRRKALAIVLWLLFIGSTFLMLKASTDPLPSSLQGTAIEGLFSQLPTGNQITFDLAVGFIVGLFVYVLVVWLPEQFKRNRIRRNLAQQYDSFKEECISIFFSALRESYDLEQLEYLKDPSLFRQYFKEKVSPDQERWHTVLNGLDDQLVKALVVELEIFMTEAHYALTVIDIDNQEVFAFLKRLSQILYRYRNWSADYDDVKQLSGFMWSVHTGWNVIEGYTDKDVIAEMIEAI